MEITPSQSFHTPRTHPILARHEVHVWRASLDLSPSHEEDLTRTLVPDELGRADRFHTDVPRRRFIVARGLLRVILARYSGLQPHVIRLQVGPAGKPRLDNGSDDLQFNLSHSGDVVLYAFARHREVGIDIERICSEMLLESVARRILSPRERARFATLSPSDEKRAFYTCWTRKEAVAKAVGDGALLPFEELDVAHPDSPVSALEARGLGDEVRRWCLMDLPVDANHAAALAVEGDDWTLACFQWDHTDAVNAYAPSLVASR